MGLERILEKTVPEPQMDLPNSAETGARLPAIGGELSLALARTFKIIDLNLSILEHKNGSARFESSSCCCGTSEARPIALAAGPIRLPQSARDLAESRCSSLPRRLQRCLQSLASAPARLRLVQTRRRESRVGSVSGLAWS